MKHLNLFSYGLAIVSIYITTAMIACNNKSDSGPAPAPAATANAAVTCRQGGNLQADGLCLFANGAKEYPISCPSGSTLQVDNMCLFADGRRVQPTLVNTICPSGSSLNTAGLCVQPNGQVVSANNSNTLDFIADTYDNKLTITDYTTYRNFLRNVMGVCDNASISTGYYDCNAWDNGRLAVVLLGNVSANSLYAYFWPYPENQFKMFNFNVGLINTNSQWPLTLNMPTSPINDNKGFMAQAKGSSYTRAYQSVISIIVNYGKLQDGYFDFQVGYSEDGQPINNKIFAQGQFVRCATKQCVNK